MSKVHRLNYIALMAARNIAGKCRRIELVGGKKLASYFKETHVYAENLEHILVSKDMEDEINRIQMLKPSLSCTTATKKLQKKGFFLKIDIKEFYNIFGNISKHFRSMKKSRETMTPTEIGELVTRFCNNVHDLFEAWEELYLRLIDLEEMIQPTEHTKVIVEDPIEQLHEFHVNSRKTEKHKSPMSSDTNVRERLLKIRKNNRKLHLILRESDFDLSDNDLEKLKIIKNVVATRDAEERKLTTASRSLKSFEKRLTKFRLKSKIFRLQNVHKCWEHEKTFLEFLSLENIFLPDLKMDEIIVKKMADFFENVLHDYKMYTNELDLLKIAFNEQWDLYTSS